MHVIDRGSDIFEVFQGFSASVRVLGNNDSEIQVATVRCQTSSCRSDCLYEAN